MSTTRQPSVSTPPKRRANFWNYRVHYYILGLNDRRWYNMTFAYVNMLILIVFYVANVWYLYKNINNYVECTDNSFYLMAGVIAINNYYQLWIRQDEIRVINEYIDEKFVASIRMECEKRTVTLDAAYKWANYIGVYMTVSSLASVFYIPVNALNDESAINGTIPFPIALERPQMMWRTPLYHIFFVMDLYILSLFTCALLANFNYFLTTMLVVRREFKIVAGKMKHAVFDAMLNAGETVADVDGFARHFNRWDSKQTVTRDEMFFQSKLARKLYDGHFNRAIRTQLRACVELHANVLDCCKVMRGHFSIQNFGFFTMSVFTLALTIFNATLLDDVLVLVTFATYAAFALALLFMNGLLGSLVRDESLTIADAIFHVPWYMLNVKLRAIVHVIVHRAQKPVIFTNCQLFETSIETFITIVKQSYSFITLLTQMQRDN